MTQKCLEGRLCKENTHRRLSGEEYVCPNKILNTFESSTCNRHRKFTLDCIVCKQADNRGLRMELWETPHDAFLSADFFWLKVVSLRIVVMNQKDQIYSASWAFGVLICQIFRKMVCDRFLKTSQNVKCKDTLSFLEKRNLETFCPK
jgi:hypothetical protein